MDMPQAPAQPSPQPSPPTVAAEPVLPLDPAQFINRELSWLAFNERVLDEARHGELPVYERLKFLGITESNLDEFFMVRVAGLKQQQVGGVQEVAADGLTAAEQLTAISARAHEMVSQQYRLLRESLLPALAAHGVRLVSAAEYTAAQKHYLKSFFTQHIFPALTPLAVDPGHPFPHLRNKTLNLAVTVHRVEKRRGRGKASAAPATPQLAVVQVPSMLPRLVPVPTDEGRCYTLLEELISAHLAELFPGYEVVRADTAPFRVIRNWDLSVDEEESEDLLSSLQQELRRRDRGAAVRLSIGAHASERLVAELAEALRLEPGDVYRLDGPLQLSDLTQLADLDPRPELKQEPHVPVVPALLRDAESIVSVVARRDLLLHHPYESFEPVVRFVEEAADDPNVLAIKQTLYRTSGDSPFVRALSRAAENGKQVTAVVEILARFDETNNIAWARRLQENGVHVVYRVPGYKTHAKVALVVRREGSQLRRYVHLGTGNYNPTTARLYTDVSLFTAREELADDVSAFFNLLTGYADPPHWKRVAVAPHGLQTRVERLIDREAERARKGEPARIVAKLNALTEPEVIRRLYAASQAGVKVELLVRGVCCLRPGVPGLSDNIRVVSVIDRFLEHSRVLGFGAADRAEVYVSSADWMHRNFQRRIELLCPVEDRSLASRLMDELAVSLADNVRARELRPDGRYELRQPASGEPPVRSQQLLAEAARRGGEPPADPLRRTAA